MGPVAGAAVGAGLNAAGGIIGYLLSMSDRNAADALIQQSLDEAGKIDLPKLQALVAQQVGPTEFAKIQTDPALKQAQRSALDSLKGMSDSGGFTAEDKANLNKVTNRDARMASSRNANLRDEMAQRGVGGSGMEFAMRQQANSAANDADNQQGLDIAGMAQKRAYDAILARGQMSGDVRGQDYSEKARAAQAQDQINQYNADARTKAAQYNNSMSQQGFENNMTKYGAQTGARNAMAQNDMNKANATQQMVSGIGSGAAQGMQAGANDSAYEEWKKKNGGGVS